MKKKWKTGPFPVGRERWGPRAHWDCGKGNTPKARFHNTAPGSWRLRDHNQPLLPNRCLSLYSPVLLSSFKIILPPFPRTCGLSSLVPPLSTPSTNKHSAHSSTGDSFSPAEWPPRNQITGKAKLSAFLCGPDGRRQKQTSGGVRTVWSGCVSSWLSVSALEPWSFKLQTKHI